MQHHLSWIEIFWSEFHFSDFSLVKNSPSSILIEFLFFCSVFGNHSSVDPEGVLKIIDIFLVCLATQNIHQNANGPFEWWHREHMYFPRVDCYPKWNSSSKVFPFSFNFFSGAPHHQRDDRDRETSKKMMSFHRE